MLFFLSFCKTFSFFILDLDLIFKYTLSLRINDILHINKFFLNESRFFTKFKISQLDFVISITSFPSTQSKEFRVQTTKSLGTELILWNIPNNGVEIKQIFTLKPNLPINIKYNNHCITKQLLRFQFARPWKIYIL